MKLHHVLAIFLLSAATFGQEADPTRDPQSLFIAFRDSMKEASARGEKAPARVIALFDLSKLPKGDQQDLGRRGARDLYNYVIRVRQPEDLWKVRPQKDDKAYFFTTPHGRIEFARQDDGSWRFAPVMLDRAAQMYRQVEQLEPRRGEKAFRDRQSRIRDAMPAWLRERRLTLEYWQWLGLAAIVLAGLIVSLVTRFLIGILSRGIARRQGVELPAEGRTFMRPFGLLAAAALWTFGLYLLDLPPTAHTMLMFAARLVLMVGVVWSISRVVDLIADIARAKAERTATKIDDLLVPLVRKALKVVIIALGIVWIADNLDMDIGALLAGLGIGGIAIALASKDTVENFFGAFAIVADRPFQVGDWVVINDIEGTVVQVGFRSTRVRTFYDSLITFPNALLIRSAVDNLGTRKYRRFKATLGVTYDTPPEKLESFIEAIRELVRRHPYTRKDYYHVYFHGFGDSSLNILLYVFFLAPDWATELRERQRLLMDILRAARELGVEFAFPTRTLHMIPSESPSHEDLPDGVRAAWKTGQNVAGSLVDRYTGPRKPPPVVMGKRPDEAAGDEGE